MQIKHTEVKGHKGGQEILIEMLHFVGESEKKCNLSSLLRTEQRGQNSSIGSFFGWGGTHLEKLVVTCDI